MKLCMHPFTYSFEEMLLCTVSVKTILCKILTFPVVGSRMQEKKNLNTANLQDLSFVSCCNSKTNSYTLTLLFSLFSSKAFKLLGVLYSHAGNHYERADKHLNSSCALQCHCFETLHQKHQCMQKCVLSLWFSLLRLAYHRLANKANEATRQTQMAH